MKKNIFRFQNIRATLALAFLVLFFASCESELLKEYDSINVIGSPSLEMSVSTVEDSTFVLNYALNAAGWLSVAVVRGEEAALPTADEMKFQRVLPNKVTSRHFEVKADALNSSVKISGLTQNTPYVVFAMATSVDGVSGEVKQATFKSSDVYEPELVSTTPAVASAASQEISFQATLVFDEPVQVNNKDGIVFRYLNILTFEITDVPAADAVAQGNRIVATQDHKPLPGQYVFLSVSDDAIRDNAGNFYEGITSGLTDQGALDGLFWRIKFVPLAYTKILPEPASAVQDADFVIELTYDLPMDFNRAAGNAVSYNAQNVIVRYRIGGTTIDVQVPSDHITFNSNVVTITPPRTPVYGETITFKINEGAFRTRYGSPVAAVDFGKASWLLSYGYTRDLILGEYVIGDLVSNWDGPLPDEFPVEITAHDTDANKVLINGLLGSTDPIEAIFDGDFATLTIPNGQLLSLGTPIEGYYFEVFNGYGGPAIGDILADGTIEMFGLGFYILGEDFSDVGWWDLFPSSTWKKSVTKSYMPMVKKPLEVRTKNRVVKR